MIKYPEIKEIKKIKELFSSKKIKVLFVSSEASPFAKAGGLGDVMHSLPFSLKKLGKDVRMMIPKYGAIDKKYKLKMELKGLKVPTDQPGNNPYLICNVKKFSNKEIVPTYFLENMEYFEKRANVYGYSDDAIRWVLLCRGALEFIKHSSWVPDLIVASDWQTGLLPNYLKTSYKKDPILSKIATIFSIHNLHYQGMCDFRFVEKEERDTGNELIPDFFNPRLSKLNWMMRGIMYSDIITTVSSTYAKEILTSEYGEGLNKLLKEKSAKIYGILNGIDYQQYNPRIIPPVSARYSSKRIEKKVRNKSLLQKHFGLTKSNDVFVIGMVTRFTEQKGFDLIEKIIDQICENTSIQLVFLGDGEPRYKEFIKEAAQRYPKRIGYFFEFDINLPHLIFAGSDAFLIPSKFEPCGITQMQAMRYGSIPIVRKTGGLADTVEEFIPEKNKGQGFVFEEYEPSALYTAIIQAQTCFKFKKQWKSLIERAMEKNFSWKKSAQDYSKVFHIALENKK